MAAFENIDPFTFLGLLCSITSNKISAGEPIEYRIQDFMPGFEIPGTGKVGTSKSTAPVLPDKVVVVSSPGGKLSSDLFWYNALLISVIIIGIVIISYIFWMEKKDKEEALHKT